MAIATPARSYLLCCIERTGSTLLALALQRTGLAGRPREYFNPVEQDKPWLRAILGELDVVTGLSSILRAGTTPNGWFGAKVHWGHLRYLGLSMTGEWSEARRTALADLLGSRLPELLPSAAAVELLRSQFSEQREQRRGLALLCSHLPDLRVIWLRRTNMAARAVSLYRARRTGVWFQHHTEAGSVVSKPVQDVDLAEIHILNCIGYFQEESWQRIFAAHGIVPHCVTYEDLVADHESTVRRVLEFLGIGDETTSIAAPESLRQSDGMSVEWEARYRELSAELGL
jgi:trehalose 2-sulfotransferase